MTLIEQLQRDLLASGCEGGAQSARSAEENIRRAHFELAAAIGEASNARQNVAPFVRGCNPARLVLAIGLLKQAQGMLAEYFQPAEVALQPAPSIADHIASAKALVGLAPISPASETEKSSVIKSADAASRDAVADAGELNIESSVTLAPSAQDIPSDANAQS